MKRVARQVCIRCGELFYASPRQLEKGYGKYCNNRCYGDSMRGVRKPPRIYTYRPTELHRLNMSKGQLGRVFSSETRQKIREANTKHGMSNSREYRSWSLMKSRCSEASDKYKYYAGRGIKVCPRWLNSFSNFYADMGPKPSILHTIDRIDNDGDYEPGNCRWATMKEQNNNRRPRILV